MPFFYSSDGVKIHYDIHGGGQPVVFLHGIPGRALNWAQVVEILKDEFLIVTIDFRGYGLSEKPPRFTMLDHVGDVESLINELGLKTGETILVGHSYGTMISLILSSRSPLKGLVLVSPPLKLRKDFTDFMILHFPSWAWKPLLFSENFLTRKLYRKLFFSPSTPKGVYRKFIKENAKYIASLPSQSFKNPSTFEYRAEDYSREVRAKATVIVGKDDRVTPPEEAEKVAELLNAECIVLPKAGHMLPYEKPETLTEIIHDFCTSIS